MCRLLVLVLFSLLACLPGAVAANFTLVYHHVGQGANGAIGVQPQELRQRVERLRALGYRFVTSSQIPGLAPAERTATLEFDDGFEDVYRLAFPLLRELGVPATVYPIVDLIGTPGHMSAAQLAEMRAAGWEVGSHSRSHASLPDLTPASLERELAPVAGAPCLAYPFSRHDARVRRVTAEHYACGVGGAFGVQADDPYALRGSLVTPWDDALLPYRAASGLDLRAPMLLLGLGVATLDPASGPGQAPAFWNPAPFELLGGGMYSLEYYAGRRSSRFAARQGDWVVSAVFDRGPGRYDALTLAHHAGPLTLAAGWSNAGPLLGAALALDGSGELWARYGGHLTLGAELIPLDYARVRLEYDLRGGPAAEASYALPWNSGEGRPLRLLAGYQGQWYLGGEYRMGSFALRLRAAPATRSFGVGFSSVW